MKRARMQGSTRAFAFGVALIATVSCERSAAPDGALVLSAAADLAAALPELSRVFENETGITVATTVGASGMLAQQILNGAPVDVFASADRSWIDRIDAAGLTLAGTRAPYAQGSLAVMIAATVDSVPASFDALRNVRFRRIAIANPDVAPYGRAARQALARSGIYADVEHRLIIGENVRQALDYVIGENVDAAIVARALVPLGARWIGVPPELHDPLYQDIVVIGSSTQADAARSFIGFLTRGNGRTILERFHFTMPDSVP